MSLVELATDAATIISGVVSVIILLGLIVDTLTHGWVRNSVRNWLGIEQLRHDHHDTQTFLIDLGEAHNNLAHTVCDEHDVNGEQNRPVKVNTNYYAARLDDNDGVSRGDFLGSD